MQRMNKVIVSVIALMSFETIAMDPPKPEKQEQPQEGSSYFGGFGTRLYGAYETATGIVSTASEYVSPTISTISEGLQSQAEQKLRYVMTRRDPTTQHKMVGLIYDEAEYNKTKGHYDAILSNFSGCDPEKHVQPFQKRLAIAVPIAHELLQIEKANEENLTNFKRFIVLNGPVLPLYISTPLTTKYDTLVLALKEENERALEALNMNLEALNINK